MMDYYRSPEALVRLRRAGKREERGQQKEDKERICPALGGLPAWALGPHPPHPDLHHCPGLPRPPAWGAGQYCEGRRCWGAARGSSVTFLGMEASLQFASARDGKGMRLLCPFLHLDCPGLPGWDRGGVALVPQHRLLSLSSAPKGQGRKLSRGEVAKPSAPTFIRLQHLARSLALND